MSNQNNIEERTWGEVLTFEEFDLGEVYTETGVRDVLTTMRVEGELEESVEVGIREVIPMEEIGLSSILEQRRTMEETNTISLSDMIRRSLENVPEEIVYEEVEDNTDASIEEELLRALYSNVREEEPSDEEEIELDDEGFQEEDELGFTREEEGEIDLTENTISLHDLFNMTSNRVENLDNNREVSLLDIKESEMSGTYTRPEISRLTDTSTETFEFGEDVLRIEPMNTVYGGLQITRENYEEFQEKSIGELNEQLALERQARMNNRNNTETKVREILAQMFGTGRKELYGYDKVGRTEEGVPYVKAVLSTRFTKLNDRRFRHQSEMRSSSRNVAVANKNPSVVGYIEMTIKGTRDSGFEITVKDSEGESLQYLEGKVRWLQEERVDEDLWALYMKTQFEFEPTITTIQELKTLRFLEN